MNLWQRIDHALADLELLQMQGMGCRPRYSGEIVGLNVGDLYAMDGTPKVRVRVRREIAKGKRAGDVFLPDRLVTKLARFLKWKKRRDERLDNTAPLFCAQSGRRLSKRRGQVMWRPGQGRGRSRGG